MIISLSYGMSSLPGKVSNVFTLNIRTILLFTVPILKINLHILLTSIVSRESECRPWSNCLDFDLGLHCLLRLYYVGIFRVNMVVYFKELDMVKTYVLVHLCIKQSPFAQSKWCTNWLKAEMLISLMSHRSPPVGCYETPLLSIAVTICYVMWFVITLYEFDVTLCWFSISLSDFIVTLYELAVTFCASINTLCGSVFY